MAVNLDGKITIDQKKCEHSRGCIAARSCPMKAIKYTDDRIMVDLKLCLGCGKCVEVCPNKAISQSKK